MLSLERAKTEVDVAAFICRLDEPVLAEVKLAGLAIRAEYRDEALTLAATRGDGATGEDVTTTVVRGSGLTGLPARLPGCGPARLAARSS